MKSSSIRNSINKVLEGNTVTEPLYLVYDWFVTNRKIDWQSLFDLGLGQINHASLVDIERPHLKIVETDTYNGEHKKTEVQWITDAGELRECTVDGWKQEHLIKTSTDYKIMQRAFEDVRFIPTNKYFDASEQVLGESGITFGHLGQSNDLGYFRTPFQVVQIDFTGLEQFSLDIATELPELMELIEMMNEQLLQAFKCITKTKAIHIKLWENLSIETMGPELFRKYQVPLYDKLVNILDGAGKKLHVHYDGKLQLIANDIQKLGFYGIDSLTPSPEGDVTIAEARQLWPEKFLWMHPSLTWDALTDTELINNVLHMIRDADTRFCLQISEEVPPNWKRTVPLILKTLNEYS
jgi:hypothetical protein